MKLLQSALCVETAAGPLRVPVTARAQLSALQPGGPSLRSTMRLPKARLTRERRMMIGLMMGEG